MRGWNRHGVWRIAIAAVVAVALWPVMGKAAVERVALVVGNGGYDRQHIPPLPNPVNDARLMAGALEGVGFDVRLVTDADIATMRAEIEGFGKRLRRAGGDAVGLFYYAGHGVESRGANYLIPVGAEIESTVEFEIDAVPARWVLSFMEAAGNRLNMVILDACRNNPYGTGRGSPQGLASMDAPSGSLIAYSAAPGQAATDGAGDNSPYTAALAARLAEPGLRLEDVFKRVRVEVEEATRGGQTPWENSSLRGDFHFVAPAAQEPPATTVATVTAPPPSPTPQQQAGQAYEAAERTNTVAAFRLVAEQFPGTFYAALAAEQITKLEQAAQPAPAGPSAEAAERSLGLKRAERRRIQAALLKSGFHPGSPDGLFGPRTREAITRWQSAKGAEATGYLDAEAARTLLAVAPPTEAVAPGPTGPNWVTAHNQPCKLWTDAPEYVDTVTWSGGCADGMASGYGKVVWQGKGSLGEQTYEGDVRGGNYHGRGTYTWSNGNRYVGDFVDGNFTGRGTYTWADGGRYDGDYVDGKLHGRGVRTWANGDRYEGDWRDDKRAGRGVYTWANGYRYEGAWRDDKPHGFGLATNPSGKEYRGTWKRGCFGTKDGGWASFATTAEACGFE